MQNSSLYIGTHQSRRSFGRSADDDDDDKPTNADWKPSINHRAEASIVTDCTLVVYSRSHVAGSVDPYIGLKSS
jgi:hypothetical protein